MFYCPVCGFLSLLLLFLSHIGIAIWNSETSSSSKYFVPNAGGGVASVYIVEMVAVSAESVAEGMACVLYGGAAWYEQ